jgi:hypothetical protein
MPAKSLNQVNLIGNMCSAIQVKQTKGKYYGRFAFAVDRGYKGDDDHASDFFQCSIWNEFLLKKARTYLRKGRKLFITGAMRMMFRDGVFVPDLRITDFYMLDDKIPESADVSKHKELTNA